MYNSTNIPVLQEEEKDFYDAKGQNSTYLWVEGELVRQDRGIFWGDTFFIA